MKNRVLLPALIFALLIALGSIPAMADSTLYDNTGSGSYNTQGWGVSDEVTNSFVLSQNSTVTSASLALWLFIPPGDFGPDSVTSVTWQITTSPNPDIVNQTVTGLPPGAVTSNVLSSTTVSSLLAAQDGFSIDNVVFSLPNLALDANTTYWLEIDGVTTTLGINNAYWDESDGSSTAFEGAIGQLTSPTGGSETFQILGNADTAATPEPSSFLLLGSGLAGLAGLIKRKLAA